MEEGKAQKTEAYKMHCSQAKCIFINEELELRSRQLFKKNIAVDG